MRIAWFANGIPGTGAGRYYLELSNRFVRDYGHEVTFYLQDGASSYWDSTSHLSSTKSLAQWRDGFRPEVAICGDPGRGHVVGYVFEGAEIEKKLWCMNFYNQEFGRWVKNPSFIKIAQTSWFYRIASEVDSPERVRLALGGVDTRFWTPPMSWRDRGLLVYPKKSGWAGIEACRLAVERSKRSLFVMRFGGEEAGWKEGDFPQGTINVGVEAHKVEELRAAYQRALLYVNSESNYGWGFSQCIAEAMSCGCVVVGGDFEGFSDMLIDGVTGLTVSNTKAPELKGGDWLTRPDPQELCEKILFLVENSQVRIALAKNARKNIEQFNYDEMARKFNEAIIE